MSRKQFTIEQNHLKRGEYLIKCGHVWLRLNESDFDSDHERDEFIAHIMHKLNT